MPRGSFAPVALVGLLAATLSMAAPGAGSLHGSYGFSHEHGPTANAIHAVPGDILGSLEFDGAGHVTGSRLLLRPLDTLSGHAGRTIDRLEQTATGTYTIGPDGRGQIALTWSPPAPTQFCQSLFDWDPNETIDIVLAGDGFAFLWTFSIQRTLYLGSTDSAPVPYTWVRGNAARIPDSGAAALRLPSARPAER